MVDPQKRKGSVSRSGKRKRQKQGSPRKEIGEDELASEEEIKSFPKISKQLQAAAASLQHKIISCSTQTLTTQIGYGRRWKQGKHMRYGHQTAEHMGGGSMARNGKTDRELFRRHGIWPGNGKKTNGERRKNGLTAHVNV